MLRLPSSKELVRLLHALIIHYGKPRVSLEQKEILLESIAALVKPVNMRNQSLLDTQLLDQVKDKKLQKVLPPLRPNSLYAFQLAALTSLAGATSAGYAMLGENCIRSMTSAMEESSVH